MSRLAIFLLALSIVAVFAIDTSSKDLSIQGQLRTHRRLVGEDGAYYNGGDGAEGEGEGEDEVATDDGADGDDGAAVDNGDDGVVSADDGAAADDEVAAADDGAAADDTAGDDQVAAATDDGAAADDTAGEEAAADDEASGDDAAATDDDGSSSEVSFKNYQSQFTTKVNNGLPDGYNVTENQLLYIIIGAVGFVFFGLLCSCSGKSSSSNKKLDDDYVRSDLLRNDHGVSA